MSSQKTRLESSNGGDFQFWPPRMKPNYGKSMKLGYHYVMSNLLTLLLASFFVIMPLHLSQMGDLKDIYLWLQSNLVIFVVIASGVLCSSTIYIMARPRSVYLLEYSCYKPPVHLKATHDTFIEISRLTGSFEESSLEFQKKIIERSGLGQETYLSEAIYGLPIPLSLATAREETEQVMFGSLDNLFASTGVKVKDIGILVVNSSSFNPTPSLTAMIVNKYKLRNNVKSFNLGGMGCSAGVIAIDLAKDMLRIHRNTYALVISTENITMNCYFGDKKSMLISNCLFRVGGAAVLLTNKPADRRRAKYKLIHVVRTHCGADDQAFNGVYQMQDEKGKIGVSLSKDLMTIAGKALKMNITAMGPLVLPLSEQVLFFASVVASKLFKSRFRPYIPDFKLAFDHFCIHAGGRAVINELEKSLQLSPSLVEASRMTLHRFGNTSSSSIWYELAYTEAKQKIKIGDRVWQIAFGSGFKCNSAVWQAMKNVNPSVHNPWADCISRYPVEILN